MLLYETIYLWSGDVGACHGGAGVTWSAVLLLMMMMLELSYSSAFSDALQSSSLFSGRPCTMHSSCLSIISSSHT